METRHQTAIILLSDIQEFTKLVREDEENALLILNRHREVFEKVVGTFKGKIIHHREDKSLAYFNSSVSATKCALKLQKEVQSGSPEVKLSIGLHRGEIIFDGENVLGTSISVVSHIESIGCTGSILLSTEVYEQIKENKGFDFQSLGYFLFKDLKRPIEIYSLANEGITVPSEDSPRSRGKRISAETLRELALEEEKKTNIWRSLWKRRVPQVLVGYLVATWTIIQFVDWLLERINGSPHWANLLLILFLLLIPSVMLYTYNRERINRGKLSLLEKIAFPSNILLTAFLLILLFIGKPLGAMTDKVTFTDEDGKEKTAEIFNPKFTKKILGYNFKNLEPIDTTWNWLEYGIKVGIINDLVQFPYVLVGWGPEVETSQEQIDQTKSRGYEYFVRGSYKFENGTFIINTSLYDAKSGREIFTREFEDEDFFKLIKEISLQLRYDMDISKKTINEYRDIEISELLTSDLSAFKYFSDGYSKLGSLNRYQRWRKSFETDSTFAFALLRYAAWMHHNQIGEDTYRGKYIKQAMAHNGGLRKIRKFETQVYDSWIDGKIDYAIKYAEDQKKNDPPNKGDLLYLLIDLYGANFQIEKMFKTSEEFSDEWNTYIEVFTQVRSYIHARELNKGIDLINDFLERTNENIYYALRYLAELQLHKGDLKAAKNAITQVSYSFPDESDKWMRISNNISFPTKNSPEALPLESIIGDYRDECREFEYTITWFKNHLYGKPKYQTGNFLYSTSDTSFVAGRSWKEMHVVRDDSQRVINIVDIGSGIKLWRQDPSILEAETTFEDEAKSNTQKLYAFQKAYQENPEHYYLDKYIQHLKFLQSLEKGNIEYDIEPLIGKYSECEIFEESGQLMIFRPVNLIWTNFNENYTLLPLSNDEFMLPSIYRDKVQIVREGDQITGINIVPVDGEPTFYAKTIE